MKAKVLLQVMASVVIGALARHKTTRSHAFIVEGTANSAMCRRRAQTRTTRGRALLLSLVCAMAVNAMAYGADSGTKPPTEPSSQETNTVKIRLTINAKAMTASLSDNATTRDFLSLLPTTLNLEDHAATEKITYLPRKLSTAGAPAGSDPSVGDIAYYAPWGNLAIFYRDFRYSEGLIRLGRIDSGIEALNMPGPLKVTIEQIEK